MDESFRVELQRAENYAFRVEFPEEPFGGFVVDEPSPLGRDEGPNAARMLAAAVGNCLSASLLLCLQKSRAEVGEVRTSVEGRLVRNDKGRWRVEGLKVHIHAPGVAEDKLARCRAVFEEFCIVTQSVRDGLKVDVDVSA